MSTSIDNRDAIVQKAIKRIDEKFGLGVDQAHQILRTDVGANRIYQCALLALIDAETELAELSGEDKRP